VLNTLWLHLLNGAPFFAMLPARALKNAVLFPFEAALMYALTLFLAKNRSRILPGL